MSHLVEMKGNKNKRKIFIGKLSESLRFQFRDIKIFNYFSVNKGHATAALPFFCFQTLIINR